MLAIYRRELRSYFSGMFGYVYLAFYLLFSGLFVAIFCLYGGVSSIEQTYTYTSFVFLFSVPFLSLRGFADERRQKTDLLLMTLPLPARSAVLGKYFAMITLTTLGQILGFVPIWILSFYGRVNLLSALSGTLGYLLFGCALVAVGLFLSSVFENLLISALCIFAAMLTVYFLPQLVLLLPTTALGSFLTLGVLAVLLSLIVWRITRSLSAFLISASLLVGIDLVGMIFFSQGMEGLCARIFKAASLTERLADFAAYGIFDLQGIVYFLAVSALFVYFTVLSLEKRRWA